MLFQEAQKHVRQRRQSQNHFTLCTSLRRRGAPGSSRSRPRIPHNCFQNCERIDASRRLVAKGTYTGKGRRALQCRQDSRCDPRDTSGCPRPSILKFLHKPTGDDQIKSMGDEDDKHHRGGSESCTRADSSIVWTRHTFSGCTRKMLRTSPYSTATHVGSVQLLFSRMLSWDGCPGSNGKRLIGERGTLRWVEAWDGSPRKVVHVIHVHSRAVHLPCQQKQRAAQTCTRMSCCEKQGFPTRDET